MTTREELMTSDRGEREYYESKRSLKERIRLPLTLDGCEAILEMVTKALDLPLDDITRQVFAGHIHHLPQSENSITLSDIGKMLVNNHSKAVTWKLDQDAKERLNKKALEEKEAKLKLEGAKDVTPLTLAKDANDGTEVETPTVQ